MEACGCAAFAAVARSIMAVESYHGGIIRSMLSEEFNTIVTPYNAPVSAITGAITATLDALLGLDRKQPIGPLNKMPNLTPADSNALAYAVSPGAVINVVYLSKTSMKGGFYPAGINGLLGQVWPVFLFSKLKYFVFGYSNPEKIFLGNYNKHFQGELTDVSAKKEPLDMLLTFKHSAHCMLHV